MPFPPGTPGKAATFSFHLRHNFFRVILCKKIAYERDLSFLGKFIDAGRELIEAV